MRLKTRGKAVLAGIMAAGLALVATPGFAAPGDPFTITVANDTFQAGDWGDGIQVTITEVPDDAVEVYIAMSAAGENGSGLNAETPGSLQPDGTYTATLLPETPPEAPNEDGLPSYAAIAYYTYLDDQGAEQFEYSDPIPLVIEGDDAVAATPTISGPGQATVAELEAGVELEISGFAPNGEVSGPIEYNHPTDGWTSIGDFAPQTLDENGAGAATLEIFGDVMPGDQFRLTLTDGTGTATYEVTATDAEGNTPGGSVDEPADPAPATDPGTAAPAAPNVPDRVETDR